MLSKARKSINALTSGLLSPTPSNENKDANDHSVTVEQQRETKQSYSSDTLLAIPPSPISVSSQKRGSLRLRQVVDKAAQKTNLFDLHDDSDEEQFADHSDNGEFKKHHIEKADQMRDLKSRQHEGQKRLQNFFEKFNVNSKHLKNFDQDLSSLLPIIVNPHNELYIITNAIEKSQILTKLLALVKELNVQVKSGISIVDEFKILIDVLKLIAELLVFLNYADGVSKFEKHLGFEFLENLIICGVKFFSIDDDTICYLIRFYYDLCYLGPECFGLNDTKGIAILIFEFLELCKSELHFINRASSFDNKVISNIVPLNYVLRLFGKIRILSPLACNEVLSIIELILLDDFWNFSLLSKTYVLRTLIDSLNYLPIDLQKKCIFIFLLVYSLRLKLGISFEGILFQEMLAISSFLQEKVSRDSVSLVFSFIYFLLRLDFDKNNSFTKALIDSGVFRMTLSYVLDYSKVVSQSLGDSSLLCTFSYVLKSYEIMNNSVSDVQALSIFSLDFLPILRIIEIEEFSDIILSIFGHIMRSCLVKYNYLLNRSSEDLQGESHLIESLNSVNEKCISSLIQHLRSKKLSKSVKEKIIVFLGSISKDFERAKEIFVQNNGLVAVINLIQVYNSNFHRNPEIQPESIENFDEKLSSIHCIFVFLKNLFYLSPKTRTSWKLSVGYSVLIATLESINFFEAESCHEFLCAWLLFHSLESFSELDFQKLKRFISSAPHSDATLDFDPFYCAKKLPITFVDPLKYAITHLLKCNESFQVYFVHFMAQNFKDFNSSLSSASGTGIIESVLTAYNFFLKSEKRNFQIVSDIGQILNLMSRFRPSTSEVHNILSFLEDDNWDSILPTMIQILEDNQNESSVCFDCSQFGKAYIDCVSISNKIFPPSNGYSVCIWFSIEQFDQHAGLPVRLFSVFPADTTGLSTDIYIHKGNLVVSVAGSKQYYFFKTFTFDESKWYHICVIHHHNLITSSSLKLIVDGVLVEKQRVSYVPQASKNFRGIIGTSSQFEVISGVRWRLSSILMFDDIISEECANVLYKQGRYFVLSTKKNSINVDVLKKYSNLSLRLNESFEKESFSLNQSNPSRRASAVKDSERFYMLSQERLIFYYNASDHWRINGNSSGNFFLDANHSLITESLQDYIILYNQGKRELVDDGVLMGGCSIQKPYGLADAIHFSGGVQILFPLIEKSQSSIQLNQVLQMIGLCMCNNPNVLHGMEYKRSYNILAFLIRKKSHLVDKKTLELLWKICGLWNDGHSGEICNLSAFNAFFVDFGIWEDNSSDLQESALQWALNSITVNSNSKVSLQTMRMTNIVFWILDIVGQSKKKSERLISIAIHLIQTYFTEFDLNADQLRLLLEYILSSNELSSDYGHNLNDQPQAVVKSELQNHGAEDFSVRNALLEMLLHVIISAASQKIKFVEQKGKSVKLPSSWSIIRDCLDFEFLFCVIDNEDTALVAKSKTVIIAMKILDILFSSDEAFLEKFRKIDGFTLLKYLLIPFSGLDNLYASLMCMLVGIPVYKNIPHHFTFDLIQKEVEVASLLTERKALVKIPEILEIIFFLLKFAINPQHEEHVKSEKRIYDSILLDHESSEAVPMQFRAHQSRFQRALSSISKTRRAGQPLFRFILPEPKLEQSVLRLLRLLFDSSNSVCDAGQSNSCSHAISECLFVEKHFTMVATFPAWNSSNESEKLEKGLNFENSFVRSFYDILQVMILQKIRLASNLSIHSFINNFLLYAPEEGVIFNSHTGRIIHIICNYLSNDFGLSEIRSFPKVTENLPKVFEWLYLNLLSGIPENLLIKIIRASLKVLKYVRYESQKNFIYQTTRAEYRIMLKILNKIILTVLVYYWSLGANQSSLNFVYEIILEENEVLFKNRDEDTDPSFINLLSIILLSNMKSSNRDSRIDIFKILVDNNLSVIEDFLKGINIDPDLLFEGLDILIKQNRRDFSHWLNSHFDYVEKLFELGLVHKIRDFQDFVKKERSEFESFRSAMIQKTRLYSTEKAGIEMMKRLEQAKKLYMIKEATLNHLLFTIFKSRQTCLDMNRQLQIEWNRFQSAIKHISLLKDARRNPNLKKAFFPTSRWRLDLNLSNDRTRRRLNRCDPDAKFDRGLDLSAFIRKNEFEIPMTEVSHKISTQDDIENNVISTMKHEIESLSNKNLKELRKRIQKIHQETDDLKEEDEIFENEDIKIDVLKEKNEWLQNESWVKLLLDPSDDIIWIYNCSRIDIAEEHRGILILCSKSLYILEGFQLDAKYLQNDRQSAEFNALQESLSDVKDRKRYRYSEIAEIQRRRYLLQPAGLELIFQDGSNLLLVFEKSERDSACDNMLKLSPEIQKYGKISSIAKIRSEQKSTYLKKLQNQWLSGEISNFNYLLSLNFLAGRSFNDLNQYPIFPWVLQQYSENQIDLEDFTVYRDLSKPIGILNHSKEKEFRNRYDAWNDPEIPKFHYGTHYSSSALVMSYLVRIEPFTQQLLLFQSGKFDQPDRMFHSIPSSWEMLLRPQMSDVKELIAEFFFFPEFLMNGNNLDMGSRSNGDLIDNVVLPKWAHDARDFVRIHRQALESPYVTARLHEWIDLIFGFKQRGQAAAESINVFYYLTYEGQVDIDSIEDDLQKKATIEQIKHFGQVPAHLFTKPHPAKSIVPDVLILFRNPEKIRQLDSKIKETAITGILETNDKKLFFSSVNRTIIPSNGLIIQWGVPDGSVRIFSSLNANAEEVIFKNMHRSTVTAIAVTEDGDKLITGGDDSMIAVWRLSALGHVESALETGFISNRSISTSIELIGFLHGHIETISTLKVSSKFNLILSASKDLTIIAWDLNRLSCSFCLTGFSSPIVDIAICEATGDIAACTKSDIFLWDLNGVFIARHSVNASSIYSLAIASPVGHLVNFSNLIFSGHEDGSINIWEVVNILKPDVKLSSTSSRLYASSLISKHIWETQSCKWSFSLKKTIETLHKMPVRVLYIPSDKSGLWSGDWGGHAYFWSLSVEDFAEESAAAASSNLKLSIDEVREMQCGSCAKRGWKKNENRYNCKTCVKVFCEFCYMDHLRSHQPTSPLFWLPHLSSTT